MKKLFTFIACGLFGITASAQQTTVSFKPGPAVGEDAYLFYTDNNCVPSSTAPLAGGDDNSGNKPEFAFSRWTYNDQGCPKGTIRSVIRFTQLSTIPANATIVSAQLILKTPPSGYTWSGNSQYPGSPYGTTNPGWLNLVKPGVAYAWNEQTVTWNNFITSNPVNTTYSSVQIPVTNSQFNWTTTLDVTSMVSQIMTDMNTYGALGNNGFLLQLQTEESYRGQFYASSDNLDTISRPELIVTYEAGCDASFSYSVNSNNPNTYSFVASNANASIYKWEINNAIVGTSATLNYQFPTGGNYHVCLDLGTKENPCNECIDMCVTGSPSSILPIHSGQQKLNISPNPSKTGWNIQVDAVSKTDALILVTDATGKVVHTLNQQLRFGFNSIYIDASSFATGVYFLSINGRDGLNFHGKMIKD